MRDATILCLPSCREETQTDLEGIALELHELLSATLREEVSRAQPHASLVKTAHLQLRVLDHVVAQLQSSAEIDLTIPVGSHRRVIGRFISLYKRLVARAIRWHTDALWRRQSEYNRTLLEALTLVRQFQVEILERLTIFENSPDQTMARRTHAFPERQQGDELNIAGQSVDPPPNRCYEAFPEAEEVNRGAHRLL